MAISYPLNFLPDYAWADCDFDLVYRQQEGRLASGSARVKDVGEPIWRASYVSALMSIQDALGLQARLRALEGGMQRFLAYDIRRPRPRFDLDGSSGMTGVTVWSISANNKAWRLTGLPAGFVISLGDYMQVSVNGRADVYQAMEGATTSAGGLTDLFEVRPHLRIGTATGGSADLTRASCAMRLVRDSVKMTTERDGDAGRVSFEGMEDVSA